MKVFSGSRPCPAPAHVDLVFLQRQVGFRIDLVEHGPHHEQGQEQGQAHHHLVRRRRLRAHGLAQQRQHDDDAVKLVISNSAAGMKVSAVISSMVWIGSE
jgi:hypothetical protein